ncbi:uncharacterized protein [Dendropsophus ebraccatus]|uniref:uncharacterized protein n=1 Tax=Dendropsophus ebraccatus TaxID=150705 RepID=UPI0038311D32
MDPNQLRESIQSFSLHRGLSQGYKRVLLQLFGYTGHGKSSFINSCRYVLDGDRGFIEHAEAGEKKDGAVTLTRRAYPLTDVITIVDNRGYATMDNFERVEVYTQLGNFLPLDESVEWQDSFKALVDRVEDMDIDTNATDLLVPVFVYSVKNCVTPDLKESLPEFFKNCTELTGLSPIVVLTHRYGGNYFQTEEQFKLLGAENVVIVENYTRQDHIKTRQRTLDILDFMITAIHNVTFRLEHDLNPRRERVKHKKFLLRYAHLSVLEAEKEKAEKERRKAEEEEEKERRKAEEEEEKERRKAEEEERLRNRGLIARMWSYWRPT